MSFKRSSEDDVDSESSNESDPLALGSQYDADAFGSGLDEYDSHNHESISQSNPTNAILIHSSSSSDSSPKRSMQMQTESTHNSPLMSSSPLLAAAAGETVDSSTTSLMASTSVVTTTAVASPIAFNALNAFVAPTSLPRFTTAAATLTSASALIQSPATSSSASSATSFSRPSFAITPSVTSGMNTIVDLTIPAGGGSDESTAGEQQQQSAAAQQAAAQQAAAQQATAQQAAAQQAAAQQAAAQQAAATTDANKQEDEEVDDKNAKQRVQRRQDSLLHFTMRGKAMFALLSKEQKASQEKEWNSLLDQVESIQGDATRMAGNEGHTIPITVRKYLKKLQTYASAESVDLATELESATKSAETEFHAVIAARVKKHSKRGPGPKAANPQSRATKLVEQIGNTAKSIKQRKGSQLSAAGCIDLSGELEEGESATVAIATVSEEKKQTAATMTSGSSTAAAVATTTVATSAAQSSTAVVAAATVAIATSTPHLTKNSGLSLDSSATVATVTATATASSSATATTTTAAAAATSALPSRDIADDASADTRLSKLSAQSRKYFISTWQNQTTDLFKVVNPMPPSQPTVAFSKSTGIATTTLKEDDSYEKRVLAPTIRNFKRWSSGIVTWDMAHLTHASNDSLSNKFTDASGSKYPLTIRMFWQRGPTLHPTMNPGWVLLTPDLYFMGTGLIHEIEVINKGVGDYTGSMYTQNLCYQDQISADVFAQLIPIPCATPPQCRAVEHSQHGQTLQLPLKTVMYLFSPLGFQHYVHWVVQKHAYAASIAGQKVRGSRMQPANARSTRGSKKAASKSQKKEKDEDAAFGESGGKKRTVAPGNDRALDPDYSSEDTDADEKELNDDQLAAQSVELGEDQEESLDRYLRRVVIGVSIAGQPARYVTATILDVWFPGQGIKLWDEYYSILGCMGQFHHAGGWIWKRGNMRFKRIPKADRPLPSPYRILQGAPSTVADAEHNRALMIDKAVKDSIGEHKLQTTNISPATLQHRANIKSLQKIAIGAVRRAIQTMDSTLTSQRETHGKLVSEHAAMQNAMMEEKEESKSKELAQSIATTEEQIVQLTTQLAQLRLFPQWAPNLDISTFALQYLPFALDPTSDFCRMRREAAIAREVRPGGILTTQDLTEKFPSENYKTPVMSEMFDPMKYKLFAHLYKRLCHEAASNSNTQTGRNFLLTGEPGVGKSHLVEMLASFLDWAFIKIKSSDIRHKHFGVSEMLLQKNVGMLPVHSPSVAFFDECDDMLGTRRQDGSNTYMDERIMLQTLTLLAGNSGKDTGTPGVFIFLATNNPQHLPAALLSRVEVINVSDHNKWPLTAEAFICGLVSIFRQRGDTLTMSLAKDNPHLQRYVNYLLAESCDDWRKIQHSVRLALEEQSHTGSILTQVTDLLSNETATDESALSQLMDIPSDLIKLGGGKLPSIFADDVRAPRLVDRLIQETQRQIDEHKQREKVVAKEKAEWSGGSAGMMGSAFDDEDEISHESVDLKSQSLQKQQVDSIKFDFDRTPVSLRNPHAAALISKEEMDRSTTTAAIATSHSLSLMQQQSLASSQRITSSALLSVPMPGFKQQLGPSLSVREAAELEQQKKLMEAKRQRAIADRIGPAASAAVKEIASEREILTRQLLHTSYELNNNELSHTVDWYCIAYPEMTVEKITNMIASFQVMQELAEKDDNARLLQQIEKNVSVINKHRRAQSKQLGIPLILCTASDLTVGADDVGMLYDTVREMGIVAQVPKQNTLYRRMEVITSGASVRDSFITSNSQENALCLAVSNPDAWFNHLHPENMAKAQDVLERSIRLLASEKVLPEDARTRDLMLSRALELAVQRLNDSTAWTTLLECGARFPMIAIVPESWYIRWNSLMMIPFTSLEFNPLIKYRLMSSIDEAMQVAESIYQQFETNSNVANDSDEEEEEGKLDEEQEEDSKSDNEGKDVTVPDTTDAKVIDIAKVKVQAPAEAKITREQMTDVGQGFGVTLHEQETRQFGEDLSDTSLLHYDRDTDANPPPPSYDFHDCVRLSTYPICKLEDTFSTILIAHAQMQVGKHQCFAISHMSDAVPATLQIIFYHAATTGRMDVVKAIVALLFAIPSLINVAKDEDEEKNSAIASVSRQMMSSESSHGRRFLRLLLMMHMDGMPLFLRLLCDGGGNRESLRYLLELYFQHIDVSQLLLLKDELFRSGASLWWCDDKQREIEASEDSDILTLLHQMKFPIDASVHEPWFHPSNFPECRHASPILIAAKRGRMGAVTTILHLAPQTHNELDQFQYGLLDSLLMRLQPVREEFEDEEEQLAEQQQLNLKKEEDIVMQDATQDATAASSTQIEKAKIDVKFLPNLDADTSMLDIGQQADQVKVKLNVLPIEIASAATSSTSATTESQSLPVRSVTPPLPPSPPQLLHDANGRPISTRDELKNRVASVELPFESGIVVAGNNCWAVGGIVMLQEMVRSAVVPYGSPPEEVANFEQYLKSDASRPPLLVSEASGDRAAASKMLAQIWQYMRQRPASLQELRLALTQKEFDTCKSDDSLNSSKVLCLEQLRRELQWHVESFNKRTTAIFDENKRKLAEYHQEKKDLMQAISISMSGVEDEEEHKLAFQRIQQESSEFSNVASETLQAIEARTFNFIGDSQHDLFEFLFTVVGTQPANEPLVGRAGEQLELHFVSRYTCQGPVDINEGLASDDMDMNLATHGRMCDYQRYHKRPTADYMYIVPVLPYGVTADNARPQFSYSLQAAVRVATSESESVLTSGEFSDEYRCASCENRYPKMTGRSHLNTQEFLSSPSRQILFQFNLGASANEQLAPFMTFKGHIECPTYLEVTTLQEVLPNSSTASMQASASNEWIPINVAYMAQAFIYVTGGVSGFSHYVAMVRTKDPLYGWEVIDAASRYLITDVERRRNRFGTARTWGSFGKVIGALYVRIDQGATDSQLANEIRQQENNEVEQMNQVCDEEAKQEAERVAYQDAKLRHASRKQLQTAVATTEKMFNSLATTSTSPPIASLRPSLPPRSTTKLSAANLQLLLHGSELEEFDEYGSDVVEYVCMDPMQRIYWHPSTRDKELARDYVLVAKRSPLHECKELLDVLALAGLSVRIVEDELQVAATKPPDRRELQESSGHQRELDNLRERAKELIGVQLMSPLPPNQCQMSVRSSLMDVALPQLTEPAIANFKLRAQKNGLQVNKTTVVGTFICCGCGMPFCNLGPHVKCLLCEELHAADPTLIPAVCYCITCGLAHDSRSLKVTHVKAEHYRLHRKIVSWKDAAEWSMNNDCVYLGTAHDVTQVEHGALENMNFPTGKSSHMDPVSWKITSKQTNSKPRKWEFKQPALDVHGNLVGDREYSRQVWIHLQWKSAQLHTSNHATHKRKLAEIEESESSIHATIAQVASATKNQQESDDTVVLTDESGRTTTQPDSKRAKKDSNEQIQMQLVKRKPLALIQAMLNNEESTTYLTYAAVDPPQAFTFNNLNSILATLSQGGANDFPNRLRVHGYAWPFYIVLELQFIPPSDANLNLGQTVRYRESCFAIVGYDALFAHAAALYILTQRKAKTALAAWSNLVELRRVWNDSKWKAFALSAAMKPYATPDFATVYTEPQSQAYIRETIAGGQFLVHAIVEHNINKLKDASTQIASRQFDAVNDVNRPLTMIDAGEFGLLPVPNSFTYPNKQLAFATQSLVWLPRSPKDADAIKASARKYMEEKWATVRTLLSPSIANAIQQKTPIEVVAKPLPLAYRQLGQRTSTCKYNAPRLTDAKECEGNQIIVTILGTHLTPIMPVEPNYAQPFCMKVTIGHKAQLRYLYNCIRTKHDNWYDTHIRLQRLLSDTATSAKELKPIPTNAEPEVDRVTLEQLGIVNNTTLILQQFCNGEWQ